MKPGKNQKNITAKHLNQNKVDRNTKVILKQNNIIIENQTLIMKGLISLMSGHINASTVSDLMVKVDKLENVIKETSEALK